MTRDKTARASIRESQIASPKTRRQKRVAFAQRPREVRRANIDPDEDDEQDEDDDGGEDDEVIPARLPDGTRSKSHVRNRREGR